MKNYLILSRGGWLLAASLQLIAFNLNAFVFTLQEQGGLTGFVNGGGGTVSISSLFTDHWTVTVQDPRIGNLTSTPLSLAFTEPETVNHLTAYNNVQLLSFAPGAVTFDVLSDEFSPYANVFPNQASALVFTTDQDAVFLKFVDFADAVPEPTALALFLAASCLLLPGRAGARAVG